MKVVELQEKIKSLEVLIDTIPEIVWTALPNGQIDFCNKPLFEKPGIASKEINNWVWEELVHPKDLSKYREIWTKSIQKGNMFEMEIRLLNVKSSKYSWKLIKAAPQKNIHGEILKWVGTANDIRKFKKEKEKNVVAKSHYQLLIETAKDYAIYLLDRNGNISSWNSGAEKIKGYKAEEIKGKHFSCFYTEEDIRNKLPEQGLEVAKKIGRFENEGWRKRKDGSLLWASITVTALYNNENKFIGYSKITKDITEKKEIEDKLRQQNEELENIRSLAIEEMQRKTQVLNGILSNMAVGIYRIDSQGIVVESLGKLWDKTNKENRIKDGKNILDLFPHWANKIKKAIEGERQIVLISGETDNHEWHIENYLFPDNVSNAGIIGFAFDITERKSAENKIKESEERFKSLLESAPDPIIITNRLGEIVLINAQTEKLFGYDPNDILGKKIEILIPDRFREKHKANRDSFHSMPQTRSMGTGLELLAKRKDGSEFPVEVSLSPLSIKEGLFVSAIVRDVSERKKVEVLLQKARKEAENASLQKSRFLANMSHEIRTPLNAILGFSEILKKKKSPEKEDEYLNYILDSGNLLLKLIGDILDLSKIEEGKFELAHSTFDLIEMLSSCVLPYKYKANEKGIDFCLEINNSVPRYVIGDADRIKQIIINLLGNSLKFTKEGSIIIEVTNQNIDHISEDTNLKFSITDTGIGIPKVKQPIIFESFTQADNSIGREFGGSGLGLSIARQLVSIMNGEIGIISPVNVNDSKRPGTCIWFSISLPVNRTQDSFQLESINEDLKLDESLKILVVEDNIINQKLAKLVIENLGVRPDFAINGKEAIDILKMKDYSIIFMDIQMPVMDGYQATKIIRSELNSNIPIIGLTSNVMKEDIEYCLNSGMNDHLGKPYNEIQIFKVISKWVNF